MGKLIITKEDFNQNICSVNGFGISVNKTDVGRYGNIKYETKITISNVGLGINKTIYIDVTNNQSVILKTINDYFVSLEKGIRR